MSRSNKHLVGTLRLTRLALRRDRVNLSVWIVAIVGLVGIAVPALEQTYGSPDERMAYASTMVNSMIGRSFGVIDGDSMGSIAMVEIFTLTAVLIAFMNTTLVVRHTRQNEETGIDESISALPVGRAASVSAALTVSLIANVTIALLSAIVLQQFDVLPAAGSWALGFTFVSVGLVFASIAAMAAQVANTSRVANGLAGGAIAVAFLLRAIGDMFGEVDGLRVISAWPTWLSPIGWGQQVHPFTQQNWPVFILFIITSLAVTASVYFVLLHRDKGSGAIGTDRARGRAGVSLRGTFGLAWRLLRTSFVWWTFSIAVLGVLYGAMTNEFESLLGSSDVARQYVEAMGGSGSLVETFLGSMLGLNALILVAYAVQSLLRLRSEETSGRLELLLSTPVARYKWILSSMAVVGMALVGLSAVSGFFTGISYVLATGSDWLEVRPLVYASVAYVPALAVVVSMVVLLFAVVPRFVVVGGWAMLIFLLMLTQLGALLSLPDIILNMSPFEHIPAAPSEVITTLPLVALSGVALGIATVGIAAFMRRDIVTD